MVTLTGGTKKAQDAYTGPLNELTVDESNHDLRLHDGSKPGGHRIMSQTNADSRYQAKSDELAGFAIFEPQERGILVRLGPAEYALRQFGDSPDFDILSPTGYEGDFVLTLKATIVGDRTWTGIQTYQESVTFEAGLWGDLTGDLTGNVLGNVTGDVVGDVLGDAIGNHSGTFTGAIDVRGEDFLYDNGFLGTGAIAGLAAFVSSNGLPAGAIILWSGSVASIPAGWLLCDGTAGTPNLTGRFVVGGGVAPNAPGTTGGVASVTPAGTATAAGAHTHGVTGTIQSSLTGVTPTKTTVSVEYEQHQVTVMNNVTLADPGHAHGINLTSQSAGDHTHTISMSAQENRPPFYALCYIMKGS